jgi:hypothetical protein
MACVILLFVLRRFRASLQEFASLGTCGLVIFNKLFLLLLYSFTKMACVILLLVLRWFRASLQEFACLGMCGLVIFNKLKRKKKKKKEKKKRWLGWLATPFWPWGGSSHLQWLARGWSNHLMAYGVVRPSPTCKIEMAEPPL